MTTTNSQSNDSAGKTDSLLPSLVKIGVTSLSVAAVLYPLERSIIRLQASGGAGMLGATAAPFMFSYKTILKIGSAHLRDFSTAAKGSFMKNTVIANKEDITEKVDKQVIGSESTTNQLTTQGFLLSTTIIGGLDTVVTQYYANKRILTAQDIALKFTSWQQRFQFMLKGMPLRGTRNFFNAFACIAASNQLSGLVDPIIAKNKNPFLHHATTFILAGVPVAILVTPMDVIYRKALAGIKLDTLEIPSYKAVCEDIFRNGGFKKFFCGAKPTAISTVLAYAVIHTTDYAVNQLHKEKKFGGLANFFSSSDRPPSKPIDEKVNRPTI